MNNSLKETEVQDLFDSWSIYDQILDHNYMFHNEIYETVGHCLKSHYGQSPISLLDLGCGSARHLASALQNLRVCRYTGYDLSESALAEAALNLKGLSCPLELNQGDLLDGLKSIRSSLDLIFSSFALHHLPSEDKAAFFQLAFERLQDNGLLLLIDVMREEEETLPLYLEHYCDWIRSDWKSLSAGDLISVCDHIRNNDVPEKASALSAMAVQAGFEKGIEISRFRWHRIWRFSKSPS